MMSKHTLIAATGTPLTQTDTLHREGLESHLSDQWKHGMTGVLVGGTMGAMQMLAESTYRDLVDSAIEFSQGKGEIMVGAGDTSFARTRDKVRFLNERKIDGTVILSPFFLRFKQSELIDYFKALANISKHPLYLYDLPTLIGTKLELETVRELARHPRIKGIKCSGDLGTTRQLIDAVPAGFRVIVAQADLIDMLLRHGVREHLDGIFSLAPFWVKSIELAATANDWETAATYQHRLSSLLRVLKKYGVFQVYTLLLNARGIAGSFMPAPLGQLSESERSAVMQQAVVKELLRDSEKVELSHSAARAAEFEATK